MGTFRFLLALIVLMSHLGFSVLGFHPGVISVVCFLLLSGAVMAVLVDIKYPNLSDAPRFYVSRTLRIYPQFLFYAALTALMLGVSNFRSPFVTACSLGAISGNFLLVPLGYVSLGVLAGCQLVPPAWTLGLELTFYAIVPFLLVPRSPRLILITGIASLSVFTAAFAGYLGPTSFGYQLLPGTLFIFLAGVALARPRIYGRVFPWLVWVGVLALLVVSVALNSPREHMQDVMMGVVLGVPTVALLVHPPRRNWDEHLGRLSYGVYLNHSLLIWLINSYGLISPGSGLLRVVVVIVASVALAIVSYQLIERPVLNWRDRRLRRVSL